MKPKKEIGGNVVNITNAIIDAKNISMQQIIKNIDKGMIKFISNEILIVRVVNFRYMGRFLSRKSNEFRETSTIESWQFENFWLYFGSREASPSDG